MDLGKEKGKRKKLEKKKKIKKKKFILLQLN
jgi:hypothetical protein